MFKKFTQSCLSIVAIVAFMVAVPTDIEAKKKQSIPLKKLSSVETIMPVVVVYDRSYAATKSKKIKLSTDWKSGKLDEGEKKFYDTFTAEVLDTFYAKSGKSRVEAKDLNAYQIDIPEKKLRKKYIPAPYIILNKKLKKNIAIAKKICAEQNVDAVALFNFKYGKYKSGGASIGGIPVGKSKEKFKLKSSIAVIDKNGKVLVDTKISSAYFIGRLGHNFGMIDLKSKDKLDTLYPKLRKSYLDKYNKSFK